MLIVQRLTELKKLRDTPTAHSVELAPAEAEEIVRAMLTPQLSGIAS